MRFIDLGRLARFQVHDVTHYYYAWLFLLLEHKLSFCFITKDIGAGAVIGSTM
jgi:hypothetical protein